MKNRGFGRETAERYVKAAREIIRFDYSVDRHDFCGSRIALLDRIIESIINTQYHRILWVH